MSVSIYYYKLNDELTPEQQSRLIDSWINNIPIEKQSKIKKLRSNKNKLLSLAGLRLLKLALSEITGSTFSLMQVKFPHLQKPFIDKNIDFNISHSGDIVCCVISKNIKVGIDIELQRKVTPLTLSKFLAKNNVGGLKGEDTQRFFNLWTIYEAIIKAASHGSIFNMNDVVLEDNKGLYQNRDWYFYPVNISDTKEPDKKYTCHIACSEEVFDFQIKSISELEY